MELQQVLQNLSIIEIHGDRGGDVSAICCDSKACGAGALFVAISGLVHDGHDYIDEAVRRGARFIVHEKSISRPEGVTTVRVDDCRAALGQVADNYYNHPSGELVIVGVTGTNGKTTVTYLLESVLRAAGFKTGVIGTINWRYSGKVVQSLNTTPESLDLHRMLRVMADEGVTHVVMEVSSHAIDLQRVSFVDFHSGIFTNLSREHLDYHGTMENYYSVKKRFFTENLAGRPAVISGDDPWGLRLADEIEGPLMTFGMSPGCSLRPSSFEVTVEGLKMKLEHTGGSLDIESSLTGMFNISNILATAGAALSLNIPDRFIAEGIGTVRSVPGRLERVPADEGIHVFVDYAHTDDALRNVLETLGQFERNRLITVFGCGGDRDRTKRPIMGRTATELSDCTIITSDNPRSEDPWKIIEEIEKGINGSKSRKVGSADVMETGEYRVIQDREEAIRWAVGSALPGDIIIIAGKGHEDYQIVGDRRLPFDDRRMAASALEARHSRSDS